MIIGTSQGRSFRVLCFLIIFLFVHFNHSAVCAQFSRVGKLSDHDAGLALVPGPYRSYGSAFLSLHHEAPVFIYQENETDLYTDLFYASFNPAYILTEATVYPVAVFSSWLKTDHLSMYQHFDLTDDLNLLDALASTYQEPWSISLFLGQLANFVTLTDSEDLAVVATGASGFVITTGQQQIFDGYLVQSSWARLEWKLKGAGGDQIRKHAWNIKIGYRWYGLPEIANTITMTYSRLKTEKGRHSWNVRHNSCTEIELQIPPSELKSGFSRITCSYGKFFPIRKYLIGFKIGYGFERRREYRGVETGFSQERRVLQGILLQPMVLF